MELQILEWHAGDQNRAPKYLANQMYALVALMNQVKAIKKSTTSGREIAELLGRIDLADRRCARCGLWRHSG